MRFRIAAWAVIATMLVAGAGVAQNGHGKILSPAELQKVLPQSFFYAGQSAPAQARNSAGIRSADGKFFLAALVDASGYSSSIAEKYQGFVIAETRVSIGGATLPPGAYGFGTLADGSFVISDIGGNQLQSVKSQSDAAMHRPVPLKIVENGGKYLLYLGRKNVAIEFPAAK